MTLEEKRTESNSSLATFDGCPRKYEYQYIQQLVPAVESDVLILGRTGHDALEVYYKEGHDAAQEFLTCVPADNKEDALKARKIGALLFGYHDYYKNDNIIVLPDTDAVEREFNVPLINPDTKAKSTTVSLVGKLDLIVRTEDSKKWLLDHKFKGSVGEREHYAINSQSDIYLHALRLEGIECEGIIWNIIRTPSIRVKKNESHDEYIERLRIDTLERPEFYFVRYIMKRWPEEIEETMKDIWLIHKDLLNSYQAKYFRRSPGECHKYGTCRFLPLCSHSITGADEFIKKEKRHSELKGAF